MFLNLRKQSAWCPDSQGAAKCVGSRVAVQWKESCLVAAKTDGLAEVLFVLCNWVSLMSTQEEMKKGRALCLGEVLVTLWRTICHQEPSVNGAQSCGAQPPNGGSLWWERRAEEAGDGIKKHMQITLDHHTHTHRYSQRQAHTCVCTQIHKCEDTCTHKHTEIYELTCAHTDINMHKNTHARTREHIGHTNPCTQTHTNGFDATKERFLLTSCSFSPKTQTFSLRVFPARLPKLPRHNLVCSGSCCCMWGWRTRWGGHPVSWLNKWVGSSFQQNTACMRFFNFACFPRVNDEPWVRGVVWCY